MKPLDRMRKYVSSLPDATERSHFDDRMFCVRSKPFASCNDDGTIVVGLEPEHAAELLERDPKHFQSYSRAQHAVTFKLQDVAMWKELVRESYDGVVAKMTAPKKATSNRRRTTRFDGL